MGIESLSIEKKSLAVLLDDAKDGKSQLPEFQRSWVWPHENIASLIASVSLGYPIGTVMMLATGGETKFKERPVEGASVPSSTKAERLILDGQQRITSLYRALISGEMVETQDSRKKPVAGWFYVDMQLALGDESQREASIMFVPESKKALNFRSEVILDVSSREKEFQNKLFPLNLIFDSSGWANEFMVFGGHSEEYSKGWWAFQSEFIDRFKQYQIPVIEMGKETPREAVCQVFEKVNTGGVPLTVFELLTATFAAEEFDLREDWKQRKSALGDNEHRVIKNLSETDFLQAVTLRATSFRRKAFLGSSNDVERAPRVGCRRTDILQISLDEYLAHAPEIVKGLIETSKFLHKQYIFDPKYLPYGTQLIPLSVIFSQLGHASTTMGSQEKISQWFWNGVMGELYGGTTETRFAHDVQEVIAWVEGGSEVPRTISEANLAPGRLWTLRSRNSAAYKGFTALLLADGAKDWRTGDTVNAHTYFDDGIDIHHVFPKKWCETKNIGPSKYNSILNKTPLTARTNRIIGGVAPSIYIPKLASSAQVDIALVTVNIESHSIDVSSLLDDDFDTFLLMRVNFLLERAGSVMGKDLAGQVYVEDLTEDDGDLED